jgi:hypothetical protein
MVVMGVAADTMHSAIFVTNSSKIFDFLITL